MPNLLSEMTTDPVTGDAETGTDDGLWTAEAADVGRLPVVDDELYRVVTLEEFADLLSGEFDSVTDVVQTESPRYR